MFCSTSQCPSYLLQMWHTYEVCKRSLACSSLAPVTVHSTYRSGAASGSILRCPSIMASNSWRLTTQACLNEGLRQLMQWPQASDFGIEGQMNRLLRMLPLLVLCMVHIQCVLPFPAWYSTSMHAHVYQTNHRLCLMPSKPLPQKPQKLILGLLLTLLGAVRAGSAKSWFTAAVPLQEGLYHARLQTAAPADWLQTWVASSCRASWPVSLPSWAAAQ